MSHAPWAAPPAAPLPHNRRALTSEVAQPVLVTANDPVRACYKVLLAVNPQASGAITALMRIGPDGTVSDVETTGPIDPSLSIILPCVLNAVRTRRFPATRVSSLVSYPFEFATTPGQSPPAGAGLSHPRPGEIQVPNPEVLSVRAWAPSVSSNPSPVATLTGTLAAEVLPDVTSLVGSCYAAALVVTPDMAGDFTLRMDVEPSGAVSRIHIPDPTALAGPVQECITTLGHRLQFPPAVSGSIVTIPVSLRHDDSAAPAPTSAIGLGGFAPPP